MKFTALSKSSRGIIYLIFTITLFFSCQKSYKEPENISITRPLKNIETPANLKNLLPYLNTGDKGARSIGDFIIIGYNYFSKNPTDELWIVVLAPGSCGFSNAKIGAYLKNGQFSMIIASYVYDTIAYKTGDLSTYTGTTSIYNQQLQKLKEFVYENGKLKKVNLTACSGCSMADPNSPAPPDYTDWCASLPALCDYNNGSGTGSNPADPNVQMQLPGGGGSSAGANIPAFNDYAITPFIWNFTTDDNTGFIDSDPSTEPDFQFDLSDNYETNYPRFTHMVKTLKTFVKNNPKVLNALQTYTNLSKQQILNDLTYGHGPKIKVEEMTGRFGFYDKNNGLKTLHMRASYVRGLEQSFLESTQEATAFLLAVTILHEYVHLGRALNNISEGVYDFGLGFERDAFNVIVDDDNAGAVVIKFSKYF